MFSCGMARREIPNERKAAYYLGMGLMVIGVLLFVSNFFGDISPARALGGMGLVVAGGILRGIGARGLAGSGIILDPEQAREDVEPWSRMGGGMVKDALDESGIDIGNGKGQGTNADFDEKLRKLHKLKEDGILTEEEYQEQKREILDSI